MIHIQTSYYLLKAAEVKSISSEKKENCTHALVIYVMIREINSIMSHTTNFIEY